MLQTGLQPQLKCVAEVEFVYNYRQVVSLNNKLRTSDKTGKHQQFFAEKENVGSGMENRDEREGKFLAREGD